MRRSLFRRGLLIAVVGGAFCAGLTVAACTASSTSASPDSGVGNNDANTGGDGGGACANTTTLQIHFNPMYSAFVTDNSTHTFQVPAVVTGTKETATWSASDPSAVSFTPDPTTGGTMITLKSAASSVTIQAQAGTLCASAKLTITPAKDADWQRGKARYDNGINVEPGCFKEKMAEAGVPIPGLPDPPEAGCPDAGPACSSCHGANPTSQFFTGVQHSPQQAAGLTDDELIERIVQGTVPEGGSFNQDIVPYMYWHAFHRWSDIATPEDQKGIVVYLRSLPPVSEEGGVDFGGLKEAGLLD